MHAVIVAGGLGTRAHALTEDRIPKALLPVGGTPIIIRQMRVLAREGVTRLTVLAGHLGEQLRPTLAPEADALGLALNIMVEKEQLGTAGCLTNLGRITEDTLIVYGDMLFDTALVPLLDFHRARDALITVIAHPNDHPRTSDLVAERDGIVTAILRRNALRDGDRRNLVPAGIYLARPEFFGRIPAGRSSDMIGDVLPALLAADMRVAVYNTPEYLRDVGSPARHAMAERDLAARLPEALNARHKRAAIFFDVDGVLNIEPGTKGALSPDDVTLIPGAGEAVRKVREARQLAVAITNRPQVARGDISFDDLDRIFGRIEALLAEAGGVLDRVYFCPHHPDRGFPGEVASLKIHCECRKPGTLLFRRAIDELPIDASRSASIGDSLRDIGAARGAKVWAYGVRTGYGCRDAERYPGGPQAAPVPDLMFADVGEAVDFCIHYRTVAEAVRNAVNARVRINSPLAVAICGRSRSGKSIVAHAVARSLTEDGMPALHVRLDDWVMPADARTPATGAEARNRVGVLADIIGTLCGGGKVTAPGYDAATRGAGRGKTYDPAGYSVIVFDGVFAAHASVRKLIDLAVFVEPPAKMHYHARFTEFYRWKGLADGAIEGLWRTRMKDEWPMVDAQRQHADLVLTGNASP